MKEAGYTEKEIENIKAEIKHFENVRKEIQLASGDYIDLKQYEPAMRHMIDNYIEAEESRVLAAFDDFSLIDLLVEKGEDAVNTLPENIKNNPKAIAEVIENNLRRVIIEESPTNPKYYEKMSELLDEIFKKRKEETLQYQEYLNEIIAITKKVKKPETNTNYPSNINTQAKRALYDNLDQNERMAIELDEQIRKTKKDDWRGNPIKERAIKYAIKSTLEKYQLKEPNVEYVLNIVKNQSEY